MYIKYRIDFLERTIESLNLLKNDFGETHHFLIKIDQAVSLLKDILNSEKNIFEIVIEKNIIANELENEKTHRQVEINDGLVTRLI